MSQSILEEAASVVHGPRRQNYGTPLQNHTRTAAMWTQYLKQRFPNVELTAEDVCLMNVLQKVSRIATTGAITRDGLVDIAGYAANVELIQKERSGEPIITSSLGLDVNVTLGSLVAEKQTER